MADDDNSERRLLDIEDDEWPMVDPERLAEARRMLDRGERPLSVWGDSMTYGMYALNREGLLWRLSYVGGVREVPVSMILGINEWSDDDLRAWLTRWVIETRAKHDAEDGRPGPPPQRGQS
jgi:hypothetical protein